MRRRAFLVALAGAPLLLRSDPEALAGVFGGRPLALVTADLESRVVAVDVPSGRVFRRIEVAAGPRSIQAVGPDAIVAHTDIGAVSILDGRRVWLERVLGGFGQPRYTAGSPDGRWAFVTDSGREELTVVDRVAGRIAARTRLAGPARHITIGPSGRSLWIALGSSATRIAVVDIREPAHPRVTGALIPPLPVHDVAYEPGGKRVWVSSGQRGDADVLVCDARTGHVLRRLRAGPPPQHVTFAAGVAHVSSGDDGTLRVYSLASHRLLRITSVPLGSYNVQAAEGVVLTPSLTQGTLCIVDRRGRLHARERVAKSSHDVCLVVAA